MSTTTFVEHGQSADYEEPELDRMEYEWCVGNPAMAELVDALVDAFHGAFMARTLAFVVDRTNPNNRAELR